MWVDPIQGWAIALSIVVACLAVALETFAISLSDRRRTFIHRAVLAAAIAVGVILAFRVAWLADDAFISFRYAQNFAAGRGLVFNPGERVEGYTNFLWTFLLGCVGWLGASIPHAALVACLACYVAVVCLASRIARWACPSATVPFAGIALACSSAFTVWATGGLETGFAAMLVLCGLAASRRGPFWSGLVLSFAALARPDHALFLGFMGLTLVLEDLAHGEGRWWKRLDFRRYARFCSPFALVFVPWFIGRWAYYGDMWPNTFYAKSAADSSWLQGLIYAGVSVVSMGLWALVPAIILAGGRARSRVETHVELFAALSVIGFGFYVVRLGGDFMVDRFFISLLPVALVAVEIALRRRIAQSPKRARIAAAAGVLALAAAWASVPPRAPRVVADRQQYPVESLSPLRIGSVSAQADPYLKAFVSRGLSPVVAQLQIGYFAWRTDLRVVDIMGLTNKTIAKRPRAARGMPGHEKCATFDDIVAMGADLLATDVLPDAPLYPWAIAKLDGRNIGIVRWDDEFIEALRAEGASLADPWSVAPDLARTGARTDVLAARIAWAIALAEHPRRAAVLDALDARLGAVDDFEAGDRIAGEQVEGSAFHVERGAFRRSQRAAVPEGVSGGGWLSSQGRPGKARVSIPLGSLTAPVLRFAIGGDPTAGRVELVVRGSVVRSATPAPRSGVRERLVPVEWEIAEFAGEQGVLQIIDFSADPAEGVAVDAIHFPGPGDLRERQSGLTGALVREAEMLLNPSNAQRLATALRIRWDFEAGLPPGSTVAAAPLPWWERLPRARGPVAGIHGDGYYDSRTPSKGSRGWVRLPPFKLGSSIDLLIAGDTSCKGAFASLEVGGRRVRMICAEAESDMSSQRIDTSPWEGQEATLTLVDDSDSRWIAVDDIIVEDALARSASR